MKKVLKSFALILLLGLGFALVGCGDSASASLKLTINFESNGGDTVEALVYQDGEGFSMPTAPTKDGYTFGGWYIDNETFETPFTANSIFNYSLSKNIKLTVYAKWNLERSPIIQSIYVKDGTLKNHYYMGDELDTSGGILVVNNADEQGHYQEEIPITEDMISEFSTFYDSRDVIEPISNENIPNSIQKRMIITYQGRSAYYYYNLESDIVSMEIVNSNYLEDFYYYGEPVCSGFSPNCDIEFKAVFRNGDVVIFTAQQYIFGANPINITGIANVENSPNYVRVGYEFNSETNEKYISFTYREFKFISELQWDYYNEKVIENIYVKEGTLNLKEYYYMGDEEELDLTGAILVVNYRDYTGTYSEEVAITPDMVSGFSTDYNPNYFYISGLELFRYYPSLAPNSVMENIPVEQQVSIPPNSIKKSIKITYQGRSVSYNYLLYTDVVNLEIVNSNCLEDFYYLESIKSDPWEIEFRATFRNGDTRIFLASWELKWTTINREDPLHIIITEPNNSNYVRVDYETDPITNENYISFTYREFKFISEIQWGRKTVKSAQLLTSKEIYVNDQLHEFGEVESQSEDYKSFKLQIQLTFEDDTTSIVNAYSITNYFVPINRWKISNYLHYSSINTRTAGVKTIYYNYYGQIVPIEYEVLE